MFPAVPSMTVPPGLISPENKTEPELEGKYYVCYFTNLLHLRWLDIGQVLSFGVFMD